MPDQTTNVTQSPLTQEEMPGEVARAVISALRRLNATLSLNELINVILTEAIRTTGAEAVLIMLHRPEARDPVEFRAQIGQTGEIVVLSCDEKNCKEMLGQLETQNQTLGASLALNDTLTGSITKGLGREPQAMLWFDLGRSDQFAAGLALAGLEKPIAERTARVASYFADAAALSLGNAVVHRHLQRRALENQLLLESNEQLLSSNDLDQILEGILTALHRAVPFEAGGVYLVGRNDTLERLLDWGYDREKRPILDDKAQVGLVGHVAKTGEIALVSDVRNDPRYQNARDDTRSELVIPIRSGWRKVGVFNLERNDVDGFRPRDVRFVAAFAEHAGVAIERARFHRQELQQRHLQNELEIARRIQQSFLPDKQPSNPHYDMAGINVPSELVGGDYFDFISIVDSQLGITIADVSGKGFPAALIMATFRASLIAEIRNNYALRTIFRKVNKLLCEKNEKSEFVTAIYGVLDMKHGIFTFANAGHNPGILRRKNGTIEYLIEGGIAFGMLEETPYEERPVHLNPGDLILLYTDGVTEAVNKQDEMFETDRLEHVLSQAAGLPAKGILDRIYQEVMDFHDPEVPLDDLTMVAIKVK